MSGRTPVLMLGLDAADADIVQRLIAEGRLPVLGRLAQDGVFAQLDSPANLYAGGVWPTFYTGQTVPWHGIFHNKLWRPEAMRVDVPGDDWITARPFWEVLADTDLEVCIVDVPMVVGKPRPVKGVYLGGWGTHDLVSSGSWPTGLWRDLERRHGAPLMPKEHFGQQSARSLAELEETLVHATAQLCDISSDLLNSNAWQFACIVFGAIHRAGHYLWDRSQIDGAGPSGQDGAALHPALVRIYESTDAAVGRIIEQLPRQTLIMAFAVHGMGPNPGWSDLLPDILESIAIQRTGRSPKHGLLYTLKQRLPFHWARPVLTRLPASITDHLVSLWSRDMFDWRQTRYFPMPMDAAGYLRINLQGREAQGIVAPGAEYNALCTQIEELVASLCDAATGAPIAGRAVRAYENAEPGARYRRLLPDLIVPWQGPSASTTKRLVSTRLPGFDYQVLARLPSGRSGNHTGKGWLIAHGPGVNQGVLDSAYGVIDLLPTVFRYLGIEPPFQAQGQPIVLNSGK
jgi:predicted AlkP superfamily phosphohydrolase/phosphomutase